MLWFIKQIQLTIPIRCKICSKTSSIKRTIKLNANGRAKCGIYWTVLVSKSNLRYGKYKLRNKLKWTQNTQKTRQTWSKRKWWPYKWSKKLRSKWWKLEQGQSQSKWTAFNSQAKRINRKHDESRDRELSQQFFSSTGDFTKVFQRI